MKFLCRLSIKNIKNKRVRTLMVYFTVLIATFIVSLIAISANGIVYLNNEVVLSSNLNYHVRIRNLSQSTIERLKVEPLIGAMMTSTTIAKVEENNINAYLIYNDIIKEGIYQPEYKLGTYPTSEKEIACSESVLNLLNIPAKVGEKIILSYRINNEGKIQNNEFVLSGVLEDNVNSSSGVNKNSYTYSFFVSKDFFDKELRINSFDNTTVIQLKTDIDTNYDLVNNDIEYLVEKYSINNDMVIKNTEYLKATTKMGIKTFLFAFCITIAVISFSCAVLYCVYSALIVLDIQDIGKYRILGATDIQIKKMLYIENLLITLVGTFSGIVLGYIISWAGLYVLYANFGNITLPQLIKFRTIIIIISMMCVGVMISLKGVIRKSLSISPIEALNFNYHKDINIKKRKSNSIISLNKLVKLDLVYNKKNIILSIITMGISCVLFLSVSSLLKSVSIENFVRASLPKGNFMMKYEFQYNDKEYAQNNLNIKQLTGNINSVKNKISEISGIEKIDEMQMALGDIYYPNTTFNGERVTIGCFSKDDIDYLEDNINAGEIKYDISSEKPGIIYTWGHAFEKNGFNIGDEIEVSFLVGNNIVSKTFELVASVQTMEEGTFLIPDKIMKEIFNSNNATYALAIYTNENKMDYYDIKQKLINIAKENNLLLVCMDEEVDLAKRILAIIKYPTILICIFIGIIGFVTIMNTMITSMIKRKRELALYRCLGLTNRQLFLLLFREVLLMIFGVIMLGFPLGNLVGMLLVIYAKRNRWIGVVSYSTPWISMLIFAVIVFMIAFISVCFIQKILMSKSIIEQLRLKD